MTGFSTLHQYFAGLSRALREHFGPGRRRKAQPITREADLQRFLTARANHIAQTSLYGYLRTRAGMRYPQLFANDEFVRSINIAKWHLWLACLSDLAVYAGGLIAQRSAAPAATVSRLMSATLEAVLAETGTPAEADEEFAAHADRVRARIALCDWSAVQDNGEPFSESPSALVKWAPIVETLKQLDAEIVINSVRFSWQEVRRDFRRDLDAAALLAPSA